MTDNRTIGAVAVRNAERMRAYLLEELRSDLRHGNFDSSDLIAVLCDLPAEEAWHRYDEVAHPIENGWYLWRHSSRVPAERIHADRALIEDGKITSKWGCGIGFYTECAPLELPADVAAIIADDDARERASG